MIFAPVAQWIEQRSSKPKVAGSNPVRGTSYIWRSMKKFNICFSIILAITIIFLTLPGCTEAERKSTQISREADEFKTPQKLTVINTYR